jgi:hypothetical protein
MENKRDKTITKCDHEFCVDCRLAAQKCLLNFGIYYAVMPFNIFVHEHQKRKIVI